MANVEQRIRRENGRVIWLDKLLPVGPWDSEPDHVAFEAHGFPCILHRGPHGAWCGYVAVPPGHPWHEKDYGDVDADVHGGLTYAEHCQYVICHVPKEGESDNVWWLGFDCVHSGDVSLSDLYYIDHPKLSRTLPLNGEYRTVEYVRRETESLAAQARAAA